MSRRGELVVECDTDNCYAEVIYRPENTLDETVADLLEADGWKRTKDDQDICCQCLKEHGDPDRPERERGDDDGAGYADPRDARDERRHGE